MRTTALATLLLGLWVFSSFAHAQEQAASPRPDEVARVTYLPATTDRKARFVLQTAVRTLKRQDLKPSITLIAAHHVASDIYFKSIDALLGGSDVVFIEGWKDLQPSEIHAELDWVRRYHIVSAKLLAFPLQSDWEKRHPIPRATNLDLPLEKLKDYMGQIKEPICSQPLKDFITQLEGYASLDRADSQLAAIQNAIKKIYFTDVRDFGKPGKAGPLRELNGLRDRAILDGLKAHLASSKNDRVTLIYGYEHSWEIEKQLVTTLGFTLQGVTWIDVMEADEQALAAPPKDKASGK